MTQAEFEAWIAEQGGPAAVQHSIENVTVPNPAYNPNDVIGAVTGEQATPKTITIQVQKWVNKKTRASLTLRPGAAQGQYEIVSRIGPDPVDDKPATPPPTRPKPEDPKIYQTWDAAANGGKGAWVDTGPVAEKPKDTPGLGQHGAVKSTDTKVVGGQVITTRTYEDNYTETSTAPDKSKPLGQHGAVVSDATTKGSDGKTVRTTTYEDGFKAVATLTEDIGVDEPPGAPPLDLTPGNGMTSLGTYKTWLDGQTGLTRAQKAVLLKERIDLVTAAANEQAGVAGISARVTEEQGAEARSQRGQTNTRLSESQGTFRNAVDYIQKTAQYQGRNGPAAGAVLEELLARGKKYAQEMGGDVNTPTNPVPTQLTPYYSVPGQAPAAGAPPVGDPPPVQSIVQPPAMAPVQPVQPPGMAPVQPQPEAPFVPPPTGAPGGPGWPTPAAPAPAPGAQQMLYAAPGGTQQAAMMPIPQAQPAAAAEPQMGGQFAELDAIMRRAGLNPAAIDMANNAAISLMLGGKW